MVRPKHTGGIGSILTAKSGGRSTYGGAAFQPLGLLPHFDVGAVVANPTGLFMRADGLRFYVLRASDDTIHEFRLAKKWRVDSAVYVGSAVIPSLGTGQALAFKPDGTALYISDATASAAIRQYSLSTPWDLSTLSFVAAKLVSTQTAQPRGMAIKPDGTKLLLVGAGTVYDYSLTTPWLISSANYITNQNFLAPAYSVTVSPDGTRIFHDRPANNELGDYTLGSPWTVNGTSTPNSPRQLIPSVKWVQYRDDGKALFSMDGNHVLTQYGGN